VLSRGKTKIGVGAPPNILKEKIKTQFNHPIKKQNKKKKIKKKKKNKK